MRACLSVLLCLYLLCSSPCLAAQTTGDSAWHGYTYPGSTASGHEDVPFRGFWVPPGTKAVDDADPAITYTPASHWSVEHDRHYIGRSAHQSSQVGDRVRYRFHGPSIDFYGSTSPSFGLAHVLLDGELVETIDAVSPQDEDNVLLYSADNLAPGSHVLELVLIEPPTGRHPVIVVDAFVVQGRSGAAEQPRRLERRSAKSRPPKRVKTAAATSTRQRSSKVRPRRKAKAKAKSGVRKTTKPWRLAQHGRSGVAGMQLAIVDDSHAIIIDKVEHNPLSINGHPVWAALYNLDNDKVRALNPKSNSFCAGGTWLSDGSLINVGGNAVQNDRTGAADFGDLDGLQSIRLFKPCGDGKCDIVEDPKKLRLATPRWYSSTTRLTDGSAMIIGGSTAGGWTNNVSTNNPTVEFYPPKQIAGFSAGRPVALSLLAQTVHANLFPIAFTLPDGRIFIAANTQAIIYDWQTTVEQRLPRIPNGVRVTYPMSGTGVLLPLRRSNGYAPEVMLCGGSTVDDAQASYAISAHAPASDQCARLVLTAKGIARGWQVERMPQRRLMPDAVLLPDGKVLIVNGAQSGIAGYGNVRDGTGQSNADDPAYTPVLYDPDAPLGRRFSSAGMPTSKIARMYHSSATLTPKGDIMIAGSAPSLDRSVTPYPTEYRVEWLSPGYISQARPSFAKLPAKLPYGKSITLQVKLPARTRKVTVSLIDLGFVTHAVHMNQRLLELDCSLAKDGRTLTIRGPPSKGHYPPGFGWLYVLADGVPSQGRRIMVGDGSAPPSDFRATEGALALSLANAKKAKALRRKLKSASA